MPRFEDNGYNALFREWYNSLPLWLQQSIAPALGAACGLAAPSNARFWFRTDSTKRNFINRSLSPSQLYFRTQLLDALTGRLPPAVYSVVRSVKASTAPALGRKVREYMQNGDFCSVLIRWKAISAYEWEYTKDASSPSSSQSTIDINDPIFSDVIVD